MHLESGLLKNLSRYLPYTMQHKTSMNRPVWFMFHVSVLWSALQSLYKILHRSKERIWWLMVNGKCRGNYITHCTLYYLYTSYNLQHISQLRTCIIYSLSFLQKWRRREPRKPADFHHRTCIADYRGREGVKIHIARYVYGISVECREKERKDWLEFLELLKGK